MKMKWLHMEFVLIFITGPSQGKLGTEAAERLLTLALLLWPHCAQPNSKHAFTSQECRNALPPQYIQGHPWQSVIK